MAETSHNGPIAPNLSLDVLLAEKARRNPKRLYPTLESLVTDSQLFNLPTISPLQRALCRISDGRSIGELADNPDVVAAIGDVSLLPTSRPLEVVALSGIRVGKSLVAAAHIIHWSQTCDVSRLGPGEIPRISIVSVSKDIAGPIFDHVVGRLKASPKLAGLIIGQPGAESLMLRHPSGIPIEVTIVAGTRAGSSLVARWSAGVVFDEFPRLNGEEDGVVNWDDSRAAVLMRILPGGQMLSIGSPFAPHGPAYELVTSSWGKPTADLVVIKAPGWVFGPHYWTPERVAEARKRPDEFQTECAGEFASPEEALFTSTEIDTAVRAQPVALPPDSRLSYRAAMDPATRGNGWTLVITTRVGRRKKVAFAYEWRGSKMAPLSPKAVIADIAAHCREYGITTVDSDQYSADAIKDLARDVGLHVRQVVWTEKVKSQKYLSLKTKFMMSEIELPPDTKLRTDLLQVRRRATTNGVKIILPSSSDGRHCDYVPALLLALGAYLEDEDATPEPLSGEAADLAFAARLKDDRFAEVRRRLDPMNTTTHNPTFDRVRNLRRR